jgi:hypothetical protein
LLAVRPSTCGAAHAPPMLPVKPIKPARKPAMNRIDAISRITALRQ